MKIGGTRPIAGTLPIRKERNVSNKYQEAQTLGTPSTADSVSVAGIPEAELTPKVRAAISQLMQEVGELRQEVEQSRRRIAYLEHLADQDTLLPVHNRRAFVRELSRAISYSERYNEPTSMIYLDLNGFKEINDNLGHGAGDVALQVVASVLLEQVRESDAVGRLGGDEFGLILWRTDAEEAQKKATELVNAIADQRIDYEGKIFSVGAAHGITTFQSGKSVEELIADADAAMYRNKIKSKGVENGQ